MLLEKWKLGYKPKQRDFIWLNISPSFGKEMRGNHPALVVSSNVYNQKTNDVIVCPITTGGKFAGYVPLNGYKTTGRINAAQIHSFGTKKNHQREICWQIKK